MQVIKQDDTSYKVVFPVGVIPKVVLAFFSLVFILLITLSNDDVLGITFVFVLYTIVFILVSRSSFFLISRDEILLKKNIFFGLYKVMDKGYLTRDCCFNIESKSNTQDHYNLYLKDDKNKYIHIGLIVEVENKFQIIKLLNDFDVEIEFEID